jgi:hypothetical protein
MKELEAVLNIKSSSYYFRKIANNEPAPKEILYDQPIPNNKKTRVTGPFTVEAVPAPVAKSFEEIEADTQLKPIIQFQEVVKLWTRRMEK